MKKLIALAALLATTVTIAADYKGSFYCEARGTRQHGSTYNANGKLFFTKYEDMERLFIKES